MNLLVFYEYLFLFLKSELIVFGLLFLFINMLLFKVFVLGIILIERLVKNFIVNDVFKRIGLCGFLIWLVRRRVMSSLCFFFWIL